MNSRDVKGLDEVLRNLNKEIKLIHGNVQKGLTIWAQLVKGQSMKNTPVDTGNLKGSHYVVAGDGSDDAGSLGFSKSSPSGQKVASEHSGHISEAAANARTKQQPFVEIGCTAFYALFVHENMEASHMKAKYKKETKKGFRGPAQKVSIGGAKFLEKAIREKSSSLLPTVKRFAKR